MFRLSAREVRLGVDRTLSRQILALLDFIWIGEAHDDYLSVGLVLEGLGHVVEYGLACVVDAPGLDFVGERAFAEFAGLWRRRRRCLNIDLRVR